MSLEQSVQELMEAVQELTAVLRQNTSQPLQPTKFTEEIVVEKTVESAEEVFSETPVPETVQPEIPSAAAPVYEMTDAAGAYTREQMIEIGWTNETLLSNGMMVEVAAPVTQPLTLVPDPVTTDPVVTAPTTADVPATHIDDRGVVWSGEFHSAGQTKDKNGSFKKKRGVDSIEKDAYEAPFLVPATAPPAETPANIPQVPAAGDLLTADEADKLSEKMVETAKNLGTSEPVKSLLISFGVQSTKELTRDQADDLDTQLEAL